MLAENSVPVGTVIRKSMLCFLRFFFFVKSKKTFGSHLNDLQIKVVISREVREVVEGTTCISDKKLSEIC